MTILFAVILGVAVAAFVSYPFWGKSEASSAVDPELASLEVARDSKYREIRDAETDLASGKMSQEDFDEVNVDLRSDAVKILDQLDKAGAKLEESRPEEGDSTSKSGDS